MAHPYKLIHNDQKDRDKYLLYFKLQQPPRMHQILMTHKGEMSRHPIPLIHE